MRSGVTMSDEVWMTYDEAAAALGIKADSVRRRAAARKWPRRTGNDRKARVGIPRDIIPDATPAPTPDVTPDDPEIIRIREELAEARTEVRLLREQISDLKEDRDAWRELSNRPQPSLLERIRKSFSGS